LYAAYSIYYNHLLGADTQILFTIGTKICHDGHAWMISQSNYLMLVLMFVLLFSWVALQTGCLVVQLLLDTLIGDTRGNPTWMITTWGQISNADGVYDDKVDRRVIKSSRNGNPCKIVAARVSGINLLNLLFRSKDWSKFWNRGRGKSSLEDPIISM
jgi:hypothetical protein